MCLWPWACRPSTGTYNIVRPENIRLNGIHFHVQSFWVRLCNIPKEILFTASSVKAYTYTENCRLLLRSCWAFVTHADGSRRTRVFIGVCLSVCLSVPHDVSKTAAAGITKLDKNVLPPRVSETHFVWGQEVKGHEVTKNSAGVHSGQCRLLIWERSAYAGYTLSQFHMQIVRPGYY